MQSPTDACDEVEQLIEEAKLYDCVRFTWSDIHGIQRVAHIPPHNLESKIRHGTGVVHVHIMSGPRCQNPDFPEKIPKSDGNCYMKPVPNTLHHATWAGENQYKIGQVICQSFWADGTPQAAHPRFVAMQQVEKLQKFGYTIKSAFEVEFSLFDMKTSKPTSDDRDEYSMICMQPYENIFMELVSHLSRLGIRVEKFNTEWYPGVFEVNMVPESGILTADNLFLFKGICKEIFKKNGLIASFMSCPNGFTESVFHFNHSLWDDSGNNVFSGMEDEDGLAQVCRWWVAGLIKHLRALTILFCPTANCYRVFHSIFTANSADWGVDNRHASLRVKNQSPEMTYVENRLPTSAANPYIVLAGTIAAGLDGLINKLEPPPEMDPKAAILPNNMADAISALEEDNVIVDALGPEFVEWFLCEKRSVELKMLKDHNLGRIIDEEIAKEKDMYFIHI